MKASAPVAASIVKCAASAPPTMAKTSVCDGRSASAAPTARTARVFSVTLAAAGLAALPPEEVQPVRDEGDEIDPEGVTLTPRERDVLALLAEGLSNKRAARELGVSESTVKFHVQAVYSKLGVQSRAGAVTRGVQLGLISV